MSTYERPTLREIGSFTEKTGLLLFHPPEIDHLTGSRP
ncbi:keywimysin-related RiPP [Nocardia sp. NPDC051321]